MSIGAQGGEKEFIGDKLFCLRFFMLLNKAQWHLNAILQKTIL